MGKPVAKVHFSRQWKIADIRMITDFSISIVAWIIALMMIWLVSKKIISRLVRWFLPVLYNLLVKRSKQLNKR